MIDRTLSKRGIIYTNWNCNLDCPFCYYKFKPKFQRPLADVKADLIKAKKYYKLDWVDISGGEPTVYRHLKEVLKFCKTLKLKVTVITNGIRITPELDDMVDEWMISVHGTKDVHNHCVEKPVFDVVEKNFKSIKKPFRINVVVTNRNYKNFPEHAKYFSNLKHKPKRIQYIMFNPFLEFNVEAGLDFIVNPKEVTSYLNETIKILTKNNIDSVVRYLPFCLAKGFEDKVCGMSQVAFDYGEWAWEQQLDTANTFRNEQNYYATSRNTALSNATIMNECRGCSAEFICDGMFINYLKRFSDLKPIPIKGKKTFDPLFFKDKCEERKDVQ